MIGNEGSMDVLGYLNPESKVNISISHVFTRIDRNI